MPLVGRFKCLLLLALLSVSCAPAATSLPLTGDATPAASPAPSPSPSPVQYTASADFTCRLPVVWTAPWAAADGSSTRLAYIDFPSGRVELEPAGSMTARDRVAVTTAKPALAAYADSKQFGFSFDGTTSRWVPAAASALSPDGRQYAYAAPTRTPVDAGTQYDVKIVDTATGGEVTLVTGADLAPLALGNFILHMAEVTHQGRPQGLWAVDVGTGQLWQMTARGTWYTAAGGAAWGYAAAAGDPAIAIGSPIYRLDRIDLNTGKVTNWLNQPGSNIEVLGFGTDNLPVVAVADSSNRPITIEKVTAPGNTSPLFSVSASVVPQGIWADSRGLWMIADHSSLYLYTPADGLRSIWFMGEGWSSSARPQSVAGPCQ